MMMMSKYPEDIATEDLAIAISSVAILGVCHDDDEDDDDYDLIDWERVQHWLRGGSSTRNRCTSRGTRR